MNWSRVRPPPRGPPRFLLAGPAVSWIPALGTGRVFAQAERPERTRGPDPTVRPPAPPDALPRRRPPLDAEVPLTDLASVPLRSLVLLACTLGGLAPLYGDTVQLKSGVILRGTAVRVPGLNLSTAQQN